MFHRELRATESWIQQKFGKKPVLVEANVAALKAGWNFAETIEASITRYEVKPAPIQKGSIVKLTETQQLHGDLFKLLNLQILNYSWKLSYYSSIRYFS